MTRLRRVLSLPLALAGMCLLLLSAATVCTAEPPPAGLAARPPMGWNSWDAYGFTIDEATFRANATVLKGLKPYGWQYAVIDEGWYMQDPYAETLEARNYLLDGHGILIPVQSRFPSAAAGRGFAPLAAWVHAQGLKFGIHILRGIPKKAVWQNLPLAGAKYRAADAADQSDVCPWDDGNFGIKDSAAGQSYYDGLFEEYARWGVDFVKVDCIADNPYKESEIRQIADAIKRSGRPMVLSLSPGPAALEHAQALAGYSQMWRISNDVWDGWEFAHDKIEFPMGVRSAFDNLARWTGKASAGHWPDADMLPIGALSPHPGWGEPRPTQLTPDEQRTLLTLWSVARSPLILGANLTQLDAATRALITRAEVLTVNQQATDSSPVQDLPPGFENVRVWRATVHGQPVLAIFNLDSRPVALNVNWQRLGVADTAKQVHDLWTGKTLASPGARLLSLPAHGSVLYRFE